MTDDVEAPTVVDPPARDTTTASGNGSGTPQDPAGPTGPTGSTGPDLPNDPGRPRQRNGTRTAIEWGILVVVAIVIAIVIKTFLFQAFYIPSASMEPTLKIDDRVLVNKLSYDLHDLHRGDIVVFAAGPNRQWHRTGIEDLVKRVVALPGETITQCDTNRICIDGRVLDESYLPKGTETTLPGTLPNITDANGEQVLVCDPVGPDGSPKGGCKVPADRVFVMGDNRGNSSDSRINGPIKESSIVGRVFLRIWPLDRIGFM